VLEQHRRQKGPGRWRRTGNGVYLGETVIQERASDEDIKSRLVKARAAFSKLRNIWKSSQLKLETKLKIFKCNVIASRL